MPPKKKAPQNGNQTDSPAGEPEAAVMTPEQITSALAQLLEGQRQTQQQIQALLAQQNNPPPADPASRRRTRANPTPVRDAREVINERQSAREELERTARESAGHPSAQSRGDFRHTINRSRSRVSTRERTPYDDEASSTDPTYVNDSPAEVQARLEDLERQIGDMTKDLNRKGTRNHANTETDSPFSSRITRFDVPRKFKQPHLDSYDGSGSPVDHIRSYKARMSLATNDDELYCLAFPSTLKGSAARWFHSLKPFSIASFKELSGQFVSQFIGMLDRPHPDTQLLTVKQRRGESLKDFVDRFNQQKLRVHDLNETVAITAFCSGVQNAKVATSFHRDRPTTLVELAERVGKYIDTEEFLKTKDPGFAAEESSSTKRKNDDSVERSEKRQKQTQQKPADKPPTTFTPLSRPINEVMNAEEAQRLLKRPTKLKAPPEKRNRDKYCRYHKDHGHDTDECFKLKIAIEKLIEKGHLTEFVDNNRQPRQGDRPLEPLPALGNINVVSGGTSGGGDS